MANVNKVILIGNVTRDPEVKYTPKGTAVTALGLAVNRHYNAEGGDRREETVFVEITLWSRQAEIASEFLKKGSAVYIEGRLQMDTWDDKQTGQKRSRLRVVAESFQLLGGRHVGQTPPQYDAVGDIQVPLKQTLSSKIKEEKEDDIPF